ncbi:MAG: hypothetical protein KBI47_18770 [Armatimonadetes bacterium]|nr:hypothetical protein [Armatimonadota bacterium]
MSSTANVRGIATSVGEGRSAGASWWLSGTLVLGSAPGAVRAPTTGAATEVAGAFATATCQEIGIGQ